MATRSYLAIKQADLSYHGIYCHFDGYPKGVGDTLSQNYKQTNQVQALINKGYASFIKPTLAESCFYSDRGEDLRVDILSDAAEVKDNAISLTCEWLYIFEDGKWSTEKL
jgi:hypothetical protein